jgi:hypothetical protein
VPTHGWRGSVRLDYKFMATFHRVQLDGERVVELVRAALMS